MNWIILALIAVILWSVGSIITKFCRVRYFENSTGYILFTLPTALLSLVLLFFEPFILLDFKTSLVAILTGILGTITYYFFLEAVHKEEVSKVIVLLQTAPLFVLIESTFFLNEILALKEYIAFLMILIGAVLISLKKVEKRFVVTLGVILAILCAFFYSIQSVLLKYLSEINLSTMMIYREIGFVVSTLFIFLVSSNARASLKKVIKDVNPKKTFLVYLAESIGMAGFFIMYLALQQGPVSMVTVLDGLETVFIIIWTVLLSIFFPKILKEEINKKTIVIKAMSIILMIAGLYLISI